MGFFKKKDISQEPKRIEVEDLIDQNYTCSEISDELGVDVNKVYRIKKAKQKREATIAAKKEDYTNPAVSAKQELEAARIQIEKERIDFEREKLAAERADYFAEEAAEEGVPSWLLPLFSGFFQNKPKPNTTEVTPTQTPQIEKSPSKSSNSAPELSHEELIDNIIHLIPDKTQKQIRKGKITEKQAIAYGKLNKVSEEDSLEVYNRIKNGM